MSGGRIPDFGARARVYDTLRPADESWWTAFAALVELGDLRGRRILDVGCGTGTLAAALAEEARAKVWALDANEEMVAVARETVPAGVGVRRGLAEDLPFRDGWFDRVTMSLVVHLVDRPKAFVEARRVLPEGNGRIAISTFAPEHFASYWLNPYFPSIQGIDEARFPTPTVMRQQLTDAGFSEFETRSLRSEVVMDREAALAKVRGRHISTFDLLASDEIEEGTARAERELPATIVAELNRLVAVARTT